jgi:hypothetical protein
MGLRRDRAPEFPAVDQGGLRGGVRRDARGLLDAAALTEAVDGRAVINCDSECVFGGRREPGFSELCPRPDDPAEDL